MTYLRLFDAYLMIHTALWHILVMAAFPLPFWHRSANLNRTFASANCHNRALLNLSSGPFLIHYLAKILRRKSTARFSLVSTYCLLNLSSRGNSATEIHSDIFPSLKLSSSQLVIWQKFCSGNPQRDFPSSQLINHGQAGGKHCQTAAAQ